MEQDKRPSRVWIVSTLFFATSVIFTFWRISEDLHSSFFGTISELLGSEKILYTLIVFFIYIFISFVPAFIANSKILLKNYLGFSIPILIIIPSIIHYTTCTAKFCGIIDIPIVASALIFGILFFIYKLILIWGTKFYSIIITIESIIILCILAILFTTQHSIISTEERFSEPSTSDQVAVSLCEKVNSSRRQDCWKNLFQIRQPKTNICVYTTPHFYSDCFYNGIIGTYKNSNNDVVNKNFYSVCANVIPDTMSIYGVKNIEEFLSIEDSDNIYLRKAYGVITSCGDTGLPQTDIELAITAYNTKDKTFCEKIQAIDVKNKCLENLNKFSN